MSTPQSFSSSHRPRRPASPFQTISFSNRDGSPRAVSLARLAQSPIGAPIGRSGTSTPINQAPSAPLLQQDFRKIDSGTYGSLGTKPGTSALSRQEWLPQDEDPEIIRKHLVSGFEIGSRASTPPVASVVDAESSRAGGTTADVPLSEEFTSLQLQGGDITRQIYRFADKSTQRGSSVHQRSHSFSHPIRGGEGETVNDIIVPGGFRRNFIQRAYTHPVAGEEMPPTFVTRNFLHFLTLYGHFAGEDLEEWDEAVTGSIIVYIG
jgi:solute carrier family 36 (proton-coupled amino acid transporter)